VDVALPLTTIYLVVRFIYFSCKWMHFDCWKSKWYDVWFCRNHIFI